jgi:hypothetical protein
MIRFFGEADRQGKKKNGVIRSEYPTWYHPVRVDMLEEEVNKAEHQLASGAIDKLPNTQEFRNELERKKVLLANIKEDRPIFTGKDKDRVASAYKNLSEQIRDLMPTYTDMHKGLANAHDENRKDQKACVNVDGFRDVVKECGIRLKTNSNKITRKEATRVWKIAGAALGEVSNVEYLRQDEKTGTFKPERTIDQMMMEDR